MISRLVISETSRTEDADPRGIDQPSETRLELESIAYNASANVPDGYWAEHILGIAKGADWPVLREAMRALLRRLASVHREDLRVASRPRGRCVLGSYRVRQKGRISRPYSIMLRSASPLMGSCDCPDFLRNSLGVCKHLLAVIEDIAARPRAWQVAIDSPAHRDPARGPHLAWHPWRPLDGIADWLERVTLFGRAEPSVSRWFSGRSDGDVDRPLSSAHLGNPAQRLALVEDLLAHLRRRAKREERTGETGVTTVEPALQMLLMEDRARLLRINRDVENRCTLTGHLRGLKRPLYSYQRQAVLQFLSWGRMMLADDMGLGKTAQATAACHALYREGRVKRGLIIVPTSLKPQWLREWREFTDTPALIVEGAPAERAELYRSTRRGFLIVNYEQLLRDFDWMEQWEPEIIVLDEAQRIRNWATKTALSVKRLQPQYRLILTGTPLQNRLEDLVSVVEWVDDHALEPKWRVIPWHTTAVDGDHGISGVRNLETLRARLEPVLIRRTRPEVLDQLPGRTDTRLPASMTAAQVSQHEELNRFIIQLMQISKKRPLTPQEHLRLMSLLTMQRIISNGLAQVSFLDIWPEIRDRKPTTNLLGTLDSPKLIEFRELLGRVLDQPERKVVVFSQWRRMLALAHWSVRDLLTERRMRGAFFTGKEGARRRTQNLVEFHDDPELRVLFASDAGGTGLNLQRAASCCINLELPWNPAVLEQRIGRIYRIGQERSIEVYNLVTEFGIEARISGLVGDKQALFSGLFDGTSDEIKFDGSGSFTDRLELVVERENDSLVESAPPLADGDTDLDGAGAVDRELDELLTQADESLDPADRESIAPIDREPASRPRRGGEIDGAAEESRSASAHENGAVVRELFSGIRVHRRNDGTVSIEATRESAASLMALFEGMASLLQEAATSQE